MYSSKRKNYSRSRSLSKEKSKRNQNKYRERSRSLEKDKRKKYSRSKSNDRKYSNEKTQKNKNSYKKKHQRNSSSESSYDKRHKNLSNIDHKKIKNNSEKDLKNLKVIESEKKIEKNEENEQKENKQIINSRAGGVYIPPFKLAKIYEEIKNKNDVKSEEYQKMMWEMLRKSINGIINKVNVSNIQNVVYELFSENLIRSKGILARAIIKAQMASPNFTHVYASLVAIINSKLPDIGILILSRYIIQFRRAFKRNNKILCAATTRMLAHLVNQQVTNETLALEILYLYLENPTDDSVEMACDFLTECGQILSDIASGLTQAIFERLRSILHEGEIDRRIQYVIETLFAKRKSNFKENIAVIPELDLVNDEDKIIHEVGIQDDLDAQDMLDVFKFDPEYDENEKNWALIKAEILGENQNPNENDEDEEEEEINQQLQMQEENKNDKIYDFNETDLVNLHRTIYLTIISSVDYQECCHKLLKLNMREGQEMELVNMIIECCIEERTYLRFYGLLGERFCKIKDVYKENFEFQFEHQYQKVHRLETNKLRNLAKLFAHLFYTDAIDWSAFRVVKLTEEDTTSSSRIFIKIICQELAEHMGLEKLNQRFSDINLREYFTGMFCRDNPKYTRFCINFFTSIGLGALTAELREFLQNAEKMVEEALKLRELEENNSDSESSSDSESNSNSNSESASSSSKESGSS